MECNQTLIIAGLVHPIHLPILKVGKKKKQKKKVDQRHVGSNLCVCVFFPLIFLRALISLSKTNILSI